MAEIKKNIAESVSLLNSTVFKRGIIYLYLNLKYQWHNSHVLKLKISVREYTLIENRTNRSAYIYIKKVTPITKNSS